MPEAKPQKKRTAFQKIINVVLAVLATISVLLIILLGFTQTETFREILREKALEIVNSSLNGKIKVDKIEGTLFTSIHLINPLVTVENDTVIYAKKASVYTNPLQLLFKKIYIRKINLHDAKVNLVRDSTGDLNLSHLAKPSEKDTTEGGPFPFIFVVDDLNLINTKLNFVNYDKVTSTEKYAAFNFDDVKIDSLFLTLEAYADIKGNEYQLEIEKFHFIPNLANFRLNDLKGKLEVNDNHAAVKDFYLKSNTTDVNFSAEIKDVNFFENFEYEDLANSPVDFKLYAKVFDFSDLTTFVSATDIMKGTFKADFEASGTYGNLDIRKMNIDYLQTHLELSGNVKKLHLPEEMFFDAHLHNSNLVVANINELMPTMEIPEYKNLELKDIILDFKGKPLDFFVELKTNIDKGNLLAKGNLDLSKEKMKYDFLLDTKNLNLQSIVDAPTNINLTATAKGEGISPKEMNSNLSVKLLNSAYENYFIDSLKLNSVAKNGQIILRTIFGIKNADLKIDGNLNFTDEENPEYEIQGKVNNLNLERILQDTSLNSDLNLNFTFAGTNFDLQKMNSNFNLLIYNSEFNDVKIDTTNLNVAYTFLPDEERLIDINSDFARMQIAGNYSLDVLIPLLSYESEIITQSVLQKIYEFNPVALFQDETQAKEFEKNIQINRTVPPLVKNDVDLAYNLVITDFGLISLFTGIDQIGMDGNITGNIKNSNNLFEISTNLNFNSLRLISPENITYISDMNLELKLQRENDPVAFENLAAEAKLTAKRIFSGTDIKNAFLYADLKENKFNFEVSSDVDTSMKALISGNVDLTNNEYAIAVDTFSLDYLGFTLVNDSTWIANYNKDLFEIEKLTIKQDTGAGYVDLAGSIYGDGKEDLKLQVKNINAELINKLAGLENNLKADFNLEVILKGYLHDPEIKLNLNINDIAVDERQFGFLEAKADYDNKRLNANVVFLDSAYNTNKPKLSLNAFVPIDLGFVGVENRSVEGEEISVELKSEEFFLNTFGELIPSVNNLTGIMEADVKITGTLENTNYSGTLALQDVRFFAEQNNLPYSLNLETTFRDQTILINEMTLANAGGTNYNGILRGSGKIDLEGFELKKISTALIGDLAVLSSSTKPSIAVIPSGNLVVQTGNTWRYDYDNGNSNFTGEVLLKNTQITIIPQQSAYASTSDYNYIYIEDSTSIDRSEKEFNTVLNLSKKYSPVHQPNAQTQSSFDYSVKAEIFDEAEVTFIINREANQRLVAVLDGAILYESGGVAQGRFNLKEGSYLQVLKKFDAAGSIYFESDPTDPRLDVTATYSANHVYGSDSGLVAVKIKLTGPVSELGKNLASNEENIAVYKGETNIENNIPSPEYTTADALSFIVFGKFTNELTAGDKTGAAFSLSNELSGYTTSALSGVLSSFINSQIGEAVKSIEFQNSQRGTRLSVIGQVGKVRYALGYLYGDQTSESLSGATGRVEYFVSNNLIIRLERKEPIIQSTDINEKINELGIRYKFSF